MTQESFDLKSFSNNVEKQFGIKHKEIKENVLFFTVDLSNYMKLATHLKENGFTRCLTVSAVDWLDENEFEVYFLVHHLRHNVYAKVATRIPRNKPEISSLADVWLTCEMHEREMWELFGIEFLGNSMLKPLFLEDWTGKPPLRKDFNWREYVGKEYYGR